MRVAAVQVSSASIIEQVHPHGKTLVQETLSGRQKLDARWYCWWDLLDLDRC